MDGEMELGNWATWQLGLTQSKAPLHAQVSSRRDGVAAAEIAHPIWSNVARSGIRGTIKINMKLA